ncbi:MAG TPA: TIGR03620 family F420-dependent LLM class oxidoreductase [Candidatus Limnocylindria bacterium]|nr:TIGR03620 family F420-dependent LLM class oxidoreductase [Candidatus Limnocylindria bacterium]
MTATVELGRLGVWGHLDSLSAEGARDYATRAEELGFGTLWVPETVGREPFTLLGMLANGTSSLLLGTSIASIWGHDAQTTRMAALTLQEATAGRFVLGLGVSHPHLAERLRGHAFDRPLTRMREFLAAYRSAVYKGPMSDGAPEPPILLAALRERMLSLSATDADGAFPYLVTAERVTWMRSVLDAASPDRRAVLAVSMPAVLSTDPSAARQAARAYLAPYLRTPTYHASWGLQGFAEADWEKPGSDRLVDAMVAWGDVEALHARVTGMVASGADHVAVIPLSDDGTTENLDVLEAMASL